jgi:hypothetical protein
VEYAESGTGCPVLVVHGIFGGRDAGLLSIGNRAVVLDVYSRRVVGWSIDASQTACRYQKSIAGVSLTRERVGRGWDRSGGDGPFACDACGRVERAPAVVAGAGMGVRRRGGIR